MAKKNSGSAFGSRRGNAPVVVRGNTIRIMSSRREIIRDLNGLIDESAAMLASAAIVTSYNREYGSQVKNPAALNEDVKAIIDIGKGHLESNAALRVATAELEEQIKTIKGQPEFHMRGLEIAGKIQDTMNAFATTGMFAIDKALDHFREIATEESNIPLPGALTYREGVPPITEQHPDVNQNPVMTIIDVKEDDAAEVEVDAVNKE